MKNRLIWNRFYLNFYKKIFLNNFFNFCIIIENEENFKIILEKMNIINFWINNKLISIILNFKNLKYFKGPIYFLVFKQFNKLFFFKNLLDLKLKNQFIFLYFKIDNFLFFENIFFILKKLINNYKIFNNFLIFYLFIYFIFILKFLMKNLLFYWIIFNFLKVNNGCIK